MLKIREIIGEWNYEGIYLTLEAREVSKVVGMWKFLHPTKEVQMAEPIVAMIYVELVELIKVFTIVLEAHVNGDIDA